MDLLSTILIAISLCFDTLAVAICCGMSLASDMPAEPRSKSSLVLQMLKVGFFLTFFQALNPVLGYLLGRQVSTVFSAVDHWFAFVLLAVVGGKMIKEGLEESDGCPVPPSNPLAIKTLVMLGLATSIDAFAVGLSFALLDASIMLAAIVIGLTTFLVAVLGSSLGKRFGCIFGNKLNLAGGLVLLGIGIKIVLEHTGII